MGADLKKPERDGQSWRILMLFVVVIVSACAGPQTATHPVGNQSGLSQAERITEQPVSASTEKLPKMMRLISIRAEDFSDRTVIRLMADNIIRGYQFQRSKKLHFTLILENALADPHSVIVENLSKRIETITTEELEGYKVAVDGRMKVKLRNHDVRAEGRVLILTLYPASFGKHKRAPVARALAGTSHGVSAGGAAGRRLALAKKPLGRVLNTQVPGGAGSGLTYRFNYAGKPISLDLQDADVVNVLRLLADISGKNIVIEPDVSGRVTLRVDNVPWDQILDMVLQMNQLGKQQIGNVIRIAKMDKLKKELSEQQEQLKAQMEVYKARQQLQIASMDTGEITTDYLQVNYSKIGDIASKIKDFMSPVGKLTIDERTNLIIYSDYPARIQVARDLLSRLDQPNKQILIEARIVELTDTATKELGVTWSFNATSPNDLYVNQYFAINHPIVGSSLLGLNIGKLTGNPLWNIDILLQAAETAGQGKIISAPRVLTLDNVEATISQGTEIPYTVVSAVNGASIANTEFKQANLELKVTPHVTPDRRILLDIKAKKDRPNFAAVEPGQPPPIDTRSIQTQLLVDDNDTIVIGGVLEETEESTQSRTPGLHQVPIFGSLFKSERRKAQRTELLIFISPRIVSAEG